MPNARLLNKFTFSRPYFQEDLTWCVQRAKYIPFTLNLFLAASPTVWVSGSLIWGYASATVMYILIQFDLEYNKRNHRDFHYMCWIVTFPTMIGMTQRFHPKHSILRIYYCLVALTLSFAWQKMFFHAFPFFTIPSRYAQISTVDQIVSDQFRLAGNSMETLKFISMDKRVRDSNFSENVALIF